MKKFILAILAVIGFIFFVGSIGAYDNNTIGFGQCLIQVGIAIVVEFFTLKALNK